MALKMKTFRDYRTIFQVTEADRDKFVVLAVLSRKQLKQLMGDLHAAYEPHARDWRGQYQALAKAIEAAYRAALKK